MQDFGDIGPDWSHKAKNNSGNLILWIERVIVPPSYRFLGNLLPSLEWRNAHVQNITGKTETFVVETGRYDEMGGDFIFVECLDESGVTRLCLPPRVANAIASQRDSLTTRRRSITGKRLAQERKDRGELPGFMKRKSTKEK